MYSKSTFLKLHFRQIFRTKYSPFKMIYIIFWNNKYATSLEMQQISVLENTNLYRVNYMFA